MQNENTFTNWDFTTTWGISSNLNSGYPYLQALKSTTPTNTTTPTSTSSPSGTGSISSSAGGSVSATSSNGAVINVSVPSDASTQNLTITVQPITTLPTGETTLPSALEVVTLLASTSSGVSSPYFSKPITVNLTLPQAPSGPVEIVYWNSLLGAWELVPNYAVNGDTITFTTHHFTTFAVANVSTVNPLQRLAGQTRVDTSIQGAEAAYPDGASSVVLARAGSGTVVVPDALSAAGLAGGLNAPILLTHRNTLDPSVLNAIKALGAKSVYFMGGPLAISDSVVQALQQAGLTVLRDFAGQTRSDTSLLVDQYLYANHLTNSKTVFIANGVTMVDALSASPVIYSHHASLLLVGTGQTSLPSSTLTWMQQQGITNAVILGGPMAVSSQIQNQITGALSTSSVLRLGGTTRNDTAMLIDQHYFTSPSGVVVVSNGKHGGSFVDALSASAFAAMNGMPIALTNTSGLPNSTAQYVKTLTNLKAAWIMGGPLAVNTSVDSTISTYLPRG